MTKVEIIKKGPVLMQDIYVIYIGILEHWITNEKCDWGRIYCERSYDGGAVSSGRGNGMHGDSANNLTEV